MPQAQTLKFAANPLRFQRQFIRALDKRPAKKLPTLPSKLIRLAVKDMREVRAINQAAARRDLPKPYELDMGNWFLPSSRTPKEIALGVGAYPCSVCFAGSVMARSLGLGLNDRALSNDAFNDEQWAAFEFLNDVREGDTVIGTGTYAAFLSKRNQHRLAHDPALQRAIIQIGIDARKKFANNQVVRMRCLSNAENLETPAGFKKFCDAMLYIAKRFEQLGL